MSQRIKLHRYLAKVRSQVHRDALRRKMKKLRGIGVIASYVLHDRLMEKVFHQNIFFHRLIDRIRYKRALTNHSSNH